MSNIMPIQPSHSSKRSFPLRLFAAAFVISLLITVFSGWQAWQAHNSSAEDATEHLSITENIGRIMLFDEVLTMSARMAAATGDLGYEKRYDQFDPLLTKAIDELRALLLHVQMAGFVKETDEANLALVAMERQAFALTHQGKQQEAMALLTSDEYTRLKKVYADGMEKTVEAARWDIEMDRRHFHFLAIFAVVASALSILVLVATWFLVARSVRSWAAERREFADALQKSHDQLEGLVQQRTADLSSTNEQLRNEISKREQATEALRLSALKHQLLFESSRDALLTLAPPSWKFTSANQATVQLFGASSAAEFTALGPWDVSPPRQPDGRPSSEKAQEMIATAMREGSIFFEWTHQRLDGRPFAVDVLLTRMAVGEDVFLQGTVRDISARKRMEQDSLTAGIRLKEALTEAIGAIAGTLEQRDPYTAGHQRRVAELAAAIGAEMELAPEVIEGLHFGGLIHDIGKISVPTEILIKPGRLTDIELGLVKVHAEAGYEIVKGIAFPWPVAAMVRQHHERLDGSGYPQGLKGEQIVLEARILAVADVVEAMSANRPYRPGRGLQAALDEIMRGRGTLFDPVAVDACFRLIQGKGFAFSKA